mgnify:FL=1
MKYRKIIKVVLFLLFVVAGFFLTALVFPKNLNRYPALVLLFLLDLYVWGLFKRKVFTYNNFLKAFAIIIYWLPLVLLAGSAISMIFIPGKNWAPTLRNLLFGTIFSFYVAKLFMAVLLLVADSVRFIEYIGVRVKNRSKQSSDRSVSKITRRKFLENTTMASGGLILGTMLVGMFKWVHDFSTKFVVLTLKNLPADFNGYRIVQLSDMHLGSWSGTEALGRAVELINDLQPDLIVFTGDLVNYTSDEAFRFKETLAGLQAADGVLAILGNHDYGDYVRWDSPMDKQKNMLDLYRFFEDINWKLLKNEHIIISKNASQIGIIGVENWGQNPRFPQLGDLTGAMKDMPDVPVKILLSHDPSHWEAVVLKDFPDIDITLSGHTHGFQFGIEIPGIKWSPAQYIYKQWAGLYSNDKTNQMLYVNRGIGSIGYPGRIGIMPEITIFELQN